MKGSNNHNIVTSLPKICDVIIGLSNVQLNSSGTKTLILSLTLKKNFFLLEFHKRKENKLHPLMCAGHCEVARADPVDIANFNSGQKFEH